MHPYHKYAHKTDPKWVKNLNQYVEPAKKDDTNAVIKNYGGDSKTTHKAADYARPKDEDW